MYMHKLTLSIPGNEPSTTQTLQISGIPNGGEVSLSDILNFITNGLIMLGLILSLIFLIWGGFSWITSGGDKEKVDKARKTILMAIVGLGLVFLAFVIVRFIGILLDANSISTLGTAPTQRSGTNLR